MNKVGRPGSIPPSLREPADLRATGKHSESCCGRDRSGRMINSSDQRLDTNKQVSLPHREKAQLRALSILLEWESAMRTRIFTAVALTFISVAPAAGQGDVKQAIGRCAIQDGE